MIDKSIDWNVNHNNVVSIPQCSPRLCGESARSKGMTLVEILGVVVILGLIAGVLVVSLSGSMGKAKHELAKSGIGVLIGKVELYRVEYSDWPGNDIGLAALSDGHADPGAPFYVSRDQLTDPWGRSYLFLTPGPDGHPFEILSYGADGQPGGAPGTEDADVSSINLRGGSTL